MEDNQESDDLPGVTDRRTADVRRMDYLRDQVIEINELVKTLVEKIPQGQIQHVVYETKGMGAIGVICAAICGLCVLFLLLGAIFIVPELHDLKAWQDILRKDVAKIQAQQENRK